MTTPITIEQVDRRIQNKINRLQASVELVNLSAYEKATITIKQLALIELQQEFMSLKQRILKQEIDKLQANGMD